MTAGNAARKRRCLGMSAFNSIRTKLVTPVGKPTDTNVIICKTEALWLKLVTVDSRVKAKI